MGRRLTVLLLVALVGVSAALGPTMWRKVTTVREPVGPEDPVCFFWRGWREFGGKGDAIGYVVLSRKTGEWLEEWRWHVSNDQLAMRGRILESGDTALDHWDPDGKFVRAVVLPALGGKPMLSHEPLGGPMQPSVAPWLRRGLGASEWLETERE